MRRTLDEALKAVFNVPVGQDTISRQLSIPQQITGTFAFSKQAQKALEYYNKALNYLKQNDWAGYGRELQQMKEVLSQMAKSKSGDGTKSK